MTTENKKQTIKEMLKQNKWSLLISSILILLPCIVGLVFWNELPEQMATHWGISGKADGWSGRAFAVFFAPVFMLLMHWVCIMVTFWDNKNRNQNQKAMRLVCWISPVMSFFINATIYATAFGKEFSTDMGMLALIGLLFVVIGNYLPKCKQNYTMGIKVKWALENEENWNATHRFAGKMWVIGGLLMLAGIFLPEPFMTIIIVGAILVLTVVPVLYSYWYHKKQCQEGTAVITPLSVTHKRISAIVIVSILAFVLVLMFTGNIAYEVGDNALEIKASYWTDMTVDYEKITSLEYRETDEAGSRTSGYGSVRLLMGAFLNEEFGLYTRYSYTGCDSCIIVEMGNTILVLSAKNENDTKKLYEELSQKIDALDS